MTSDRPIVRTALAVGCALLATACTRNAATVGKPGGADADGARVGAAFDVGTAAPAEVVAEVLRRCHGGLVGMDRVIVEIEAEDGARYTVFAALPDRLRAQTTDGSAWLRDAALATAIRGERAEPLSAHDADLLRGLHRLVDAAALGPLHRAKEVERVAPRRLRVRTTEGAEVECTLADDALRIAALRRTSDREDGGVRVLEHRETARDTALVSRAHEAALGTCAIRFVDHDFAFAPTMFAAPTPEAPPPGPDRRIATPGAVAEAPAPDADPPLRVVGQEQRPSAPALTDQPAHRLAVFDDPGDWPGRTALAQERWQTLQQGGQRLAGFVTFFREDGRDRLAIPFRARDGATFAAPGDWDVREVAAGRALVVFPTEGDYEQRSAAGREAIERALRAGKLDAAGPVSMQPYLHLEEGPPPAARLASPVVRVSVRLR